jgi:hypothetical protein
MSSEPRPVPFSDLALARRLERAEGRHNADFVEARAKLFPEVGAGWIEVAGAYAAFDGPASPLTQTFALGLCQPAAAADMVEIEAFFAARGAPVFHEVSPLAEATLLTLLIERGYHPLEFTSVMYRPIGEGIAAGRAPGSRVTPRVIRDGEQELWAQTAARGWSELPELRDAMLDIGRVSASSGDAVLFLAEIDGAPIATGSLILREGLALLAGASTIPAGRRQGAQGALLGARLRYAAERGCDLATMGAQPGSGSQRNAERHGFRVAYTRTKWHLHPRRPS